MISLFDGSTPIRLNFTPFPHISLSQPDNLEEEIDFKLVPFLSPACWLIDWLIDLRFDAWILWSESDLIWILIYLNQIKGIMKVCWLIRVCFIYCVGLRIEEIHNKNNNLLRPGNRLNSRIYSIWTISLVLSFNQSINQPINRPISSSKPMSSSPYLSQELKDYMKSFKVN